MESGMTSVHDRFREQARRTPDAPALVEGEVVYTYRELDRVTDELAGYLQGRGVGPGWSVGVFMETSADFALACMAALKAGGAYLPLDLAYPARLLERILRQTESPVIVTRGIHERRLGKDFPGEVLVLDGGESWRHAELDREAALVGPDDLAYVVYSSGTTGEPKGILAPHRGALHSYDERHRFQPYAPGERVACNIFYVWELFRPLFHGATVYPVPDSTIYDPHPLVEFLRMHGIHEALFTPSLLETVLNTIPGEELRGSLASLRRLWLNGEVVTTRLRDRALARLPAQVELLNTYSISECHDVASCRLREADESVSGICPVGPRIEGITVRILDEELCEVPPGAVGGLHVGGPCLAKGYLKRPDLTAERFLTVDGERLYWTGDLAMTRPDGSLEVRGRCDFMVKIRGYSVHLGAIESALEQQDGVESCAVVTEGAEGDDKRLVAYVVRGKGGDWSACPRTGACVALRRRLEGHLPAYSIPSVYVEVEAIPLSPTTGKLDHAALPAPPRLRSDPELHVELGPDASPEERLEAMRVVWKNVLGTTSESIGDDANFFDLGGHSLMAVELSVLVEEAFGRRLSVKEIYEHPTLASLVARLGGEEPATLPAGSYPDLPTQLRTDARLPADIVPAEACKPLTLPEARTVFVTGATGFLGAFLLDEVIRRTAPSVDVHCLVRAADQIGGKERIVRNLKAYGLWRPSHAERLQAVVGDLSRPRLGIDEVTWAFLTREVDWVFHCGAMVNFVYPYSVLEAPNVNGTREVLRLASETVRKPVHYVSTNGIFPTGEDGAYPEDERIDDFAEALEGGYGQSKWVAEKLVWEARSRGLPVCLFRPGNIGHHSRSGVANPSDLQYHLLDAVLKLGSAPAETRWSFEATPIDFLVRAIVRFASDPSHLGRVYHVIQRPPIPVERILERLREGGWLTRTVPREEWLRELEAASEEQGDPILGILARSLGEVELYLTDTNRYDCSRFEQAVDALGLTRPRPDRDYLQTFLQRRRETTVPAGAQGTAAAG